MLVTVNLSNLLEMWKIGLQTFNMFKKLDRPSSTGNLKEVGGAGWLLTFEHNIDKNHSFVLL